MSTPVDLSTRFFLKATAAAVAALAAGCAPPRDPAKPIEEGFEYLVVPNPWPNLSGSRYEVIEFFWYGCPYCNAFEPFLKEWAARLPPDVAFRHLHVGLNRNQAVHQRLFFALEVLGKDKELNSVMFSALHERQMFLESPERIADFFAQHGVDRQLLLDTMKSPEVAARCERANSIAKAAKITGVPELAVNGKWLTDTTMAGNYRKTLNVVDYLLARDRAGG
jgi:thiol:disulfide interchange protein DsbA